MSVESLTIVVFVLGVVVLLTMALVFALARQIGILHTRLAPAGALTTSEGPTIGEAAPKLALRDMSNRPVQIGGPAEQPTLVLFVSPTCPICKELLPVAQSVAVCAPVPGRAVPPAMYVPAAAFAMATFASPTLAAVVIL